MAKSGHLMEIDERFCQCPICLEQYTEPKLLPCIHRYCRGCLGELIGRSQAVDVITCPECRKEFEVPVEGVDGFKTDFYIKNVIEYIQIQKSLEDDHLRECFDCAKKIKVTAYCFKCNDFLCKECHNSHVTKKMLKDHKQHTLSLEDIKSKNLTLEKLVALKEAPRCQRHVENLSQLCCQTCSNAPICVTCTYGSHENHKIKDVNILAAEEREKLNEQLEILSQCKEGMCRTSETVDRIKTELSSNVKEKKEYYKIRYGRDVCEVETKIKHIGDHAKIEETEIMNEERNRLTETQKQKDKEIEEVRKKYDRILDAIRNEKESNLKVLKEKNDKNLQINKDKLKRLETEFEAAMNLLDKRQEEQEKKLGEISLQIDGTAKRFENLTVTAHSIISTGNDWTAVQCIPDLLSASDPLSTEMRREFPELETLAKVELGVEIQLYEGSPIEIEGIGENEWNIRCITDSGNGNAVLSGDLPDNSSHITVINMEGKVLHQKILKASEFIPCRHCTCLPQLKVVTVCWGNEIALCDVRDGSYIEKSISLQSNGTFFKCHYFKSVTTDYSSNTVLVGGYSRSLHVFNDQLKFIGTMTLPDMIRSSHHMKVSDGVLLTCDKRSGRAYAVGMDGLTGKLLYEFAKPNSDGKCQPVSVCTDKNKFVYILWKMGERRCVLVHYNRNSPEILEIREVDNDARCVTTVQTANSEKLLIVTETSGKLYVHNV